jgi:hypothetical protein
VVHGLNWRGVSGGVVLLLATATAKTWRLRVFLQEAPLRADQPAGAADCEDNASSLGDWPVPDAVCPVLGDIGGGVGCAA